MFRSILDEVKREFQHGNMITQLIIINCAVFFAINIIGIFLRFTGVFSDILHFFTMSNKWQHVITHPWTVFTSFFLHVDFSHIFWNMIALYWFGRIVGDLLGNHRVLPLYILGGLVGNLVYFAVYAPDAIGYALGASAAVMAMVACAAQVAPDYAFNVLFIGPVKLKYIALVMIFIDLIAVSATNPNAGGSVAHLGGAALGFLYATQLKNGVDLGKPIENTINFIKKLFSGQKRPPMKAERGGGSHYSEPRRSTKPEKPNATEGSDQARLDAILDKIKQRGYDSLSEEEKKFLFNASKK